MPTTANMSGGIVNNNCTTVIGNNTTVNINNNFCPSNQTTAAQTVPATSSQMQAGVGTSDSDNGQDDPAPSPTATATFVSKDEHGRIRSVESYQE